MKIPALGFCLWLALLGLVGCMAAPEVRIFEATGVSPGEPLDQRKAERVANMYYCLFESRAGGTTFKKETEDAWVFATRFEGTGAQGADIVLKKDGSEISRVGGPTVRLIDGAWRYTR